MKKALLFAFVAAFTLLSCTKETEIPSEKETTPEVPGATVFSAVIENPDANSTQPAGTKTSLSGLKVNWTKDDVIKIMWEGGNTVAEASQDGDATFTAIVGEADVYYAAYPSDAASFDGTTLTATIPAEQSGLFEGSDIMVATTTDGSTLPFKHLCGLLKFTLDDTGLTAIKIKADDDVAIAGSGAVTFNGSGIPSFALSGEGETEITITPSGQGSSATYYAAIRPGITLGGFYFELVSASGTKTVFSPKNLATTRAKIMNMGAIAEHVVVDWFVTPSGAGDKNGVSWENAFGLNEIAEIFIGRTSSENLSRYGGGTFHMAGGTYSLDSLLRFDFSNAASTVSMTFKGGYNPASKGVSTSDRDLTSYATNFDGGKPCVNGHAMRIDQHANLSFDGINVNNFASGISTVYLYAGANTPDVTASFTHCSFSNNGVNAPTAGVQYGGAIFQKSGALTITSCTFENNSSVRGAAVAAAGDVVLTITGSGDDKTVFTGNSASDRGGAIYLEFINGTANISYSQFSGNSGVNGGGAICQMNNKEYSMTTNVSSSIFDNNTGGAGAVIYAYNAGTQSINFTNCEIKNNAVTSIRTDGGAVVTIGGADTEVSGNSAVVLDGPAFTINDGIFSSNTHQIYSSSGVLTINGGTFSDNAYTYGGVFYGEGTYTINGGTFKKNLASNSGGVIHLRGAGSVTINGGTFGGDSASDANVATTNGGVVYLEGSSSATVNGGVFKYNSASGYGGAIGVGSTGALTITSNTSAPQFLYNTSPYGGAIRVNTGTSTISGATFSYNSATTESDLSGGGAIILSGNGTLNVSGSTFSNNSAASDGGAILVNTGTASVTGGTFESNSATSGGALILAGTGTLNVSGSTFSNNTAASDGGAIFVSDAGSLEIDGGSFTHNQCAGIGGAIGCIDGKTITLDVDGAIFTSNSSKNGGAIRFSRGSAKINGSTFTSNSATVYGGAMNLASGLIDDAAGSPVFINGCKFTGNSTDGGGGGITSEAGGSVIRVYANYVGINNCAFYNNAADKVDLLICNKARVLLSNTTIITAGTGNYANPICNTGGNPAQLVLKNTILCTPGYATNSRSPYSYSDSHVSHSIAISNSNPGGFYTDAGRNDGTSIKITYDNNWAGKFDTYKYSGALPDFVGKLATASSGSATFSPMTASTQGYIEGLGTDNDTDFATWLGTVHGFEQDIDGNTRPNNDGKYWPGCYQK